MKIIFNELIPYLDGISDADADCMIQTIQKFYDIMCERSAQKLTDKTADFTQGSILKETGGIYDAGTWCIDPSGSIWSG